MYRGVFLRADEAAHFNREANNLPSVMCCPHLDSLHHQQDRDDGSWWRTCQVMGCACLEDHPPGEWRLRQDTLDTEAAEASRHIAYAAFTFLGLVLGGAIMWLLVT